MRAIQKLLSVVFVSAACGAHAAETSPWIEQPAAADFARAYPTGASGDGWASLDCRIAEDGRLEACRVLQESPAASGFGGAALELAKKFRATREALKQHAPGLRLRIVIQAPIEPVWRDLQFKNPGRHRHLGPPGPYFPDRAYRARQGGVAVLDCRVEASGRLSGCQVVAVDPAGWSFEFAALKMAEHGHMYAGDAPLHTLEPEGGVWRFRVDFPRPRRGP